MRTPARQTALQATSCAALLLALLAAACGRAGAIADVGAGTGWIRIDDIVAVRLAGGPSEREGVLQVQDGNGTWYSGICMGDDLDRGQIAVVVCRQLGFGDHGQPAYGLGSLPTNGTAFSGPSLYGEAECTGEEAKLGECLFYLYASSDPHCNNPNDLPIDYRSFTLGAICPGGIDVRGLRLAPGSGTQPGEGLLEAQLADGSWGAVVADWSWISFQELAEVACRELGYGDGPALFRGDGFFNAGGTAAAGVNVVACNSSTASRLADCELTRPLKSSSLVGVACNGSRAVTAVRLVGGASPLEGHVEVQVAGHGPAWASVCPWYALSLYEDGNQRVGAIAAAACRQLGFSGSEQFSEDNPGYGGQAPAPVLVVMDCSADARSLSDCSLMVSNASVEYFQLRVACTS